MKFYTDDDRTASLTRLIPDLFQYKTILYIGARDDRFDYGVEFANANYEITVIEAFLLNAYQLQKIPWIYDVIEQDIRKFESSKKYDIVFWWHGPEHIEESELPYILSKLENITNIATVLGCPWGDFAQGPLYNNPFEIHRSSLDYPIFEKLGYTVECLVGKNIHGSNITSVKRKNK